MPRPKEFVEMSASCNHCDIEEKVHVCCGRHPLTGKRAILEISGNTSRLACPNLDEHGSCTIYANRPGPCREFFCERFGSGFDIFPNEFLVDIFAGKPED